MEKRDTREIKILTEKCKDVISQKVEIFRKKEIKS
jgi:hypothetical protein